MRNDLERKFPSETVFSVLREIWSGCGVARSSDAAYMRQTFASTQSCNVATINKLHFGFRKFLMDLEIAST